MELKDPFLSKENKWAYSLQKEWITSHDEHKISTWFKSLPANLVFARKGILMLLNFKRLKEEFVNYFVSAQVNLSNRSRREIFTSMLKSLVCENLYVLKTDSREMRT